MKTIEVRKGEDPLVLARRCGGYYRAVMGDDGKRVTPLVGYAGTYEPGKQWVGEEYFNFAMVERFSPALEFVANLLICKLLAKEDFGGEFTRDVGFCGAPEGGKALAVVLAQMAKTQYIFPEKKVTALKTEGQREQSELVFDRHVPGKGDAWWIVEDVCNNFSTTARLIALIEKCDAMVMGVVCFLNRSPDVCETFRPKSSDGCAEDEYLVVPLERRVIAEYRQDDARVIEDIRAGNVVWKPKNEWARLTSMMARF